jgi:hypothetical protein
VLNFDVLELANQNQAHFLQNALVKTQNYALKTLDLLEVRDTVSVVDFYFD